VKTIRDVDLQKTHNKASQRRQKAARLNFNVERQLLAGFKPL